MNTMTSNIRVVVTESVVRETEWLLSPKDRMETVVYWFGRTKPGQVAVLAAIRPQQTRTRGSFQVSAQANADVTAFACEHQLRLVAQIHSHPGPFVGHSPGDDVGAPFVFSGFYSIVVPLYGAHGVVPLTGCGIHVYRDVFRRLTRAEVESTFHIVPHADHQL